jgi:hypothetical protein
MRTFLSYVETTWVHSMVQSMKTILNGPLRALLSVEVLYQNSAFLCDVILNVGQVHVFLLTKWMQALKWLP